MKRCGITFEIIADYHDGRLDSAATRQTREHLNSGCPQCQENLAWLEQATNTMHQAESVIVPQSLKDRAYAIFAERFRAPVRRSWLAHLQFDGRGSAVTLAGARGSQADSFQLVYSTDAYDIEFFQEPAEDGNWYVIGQVMPKEGDAVLITSEVVLTAGNQDQRIFSTQSEEFHLPAIPVGVYDMTLRLVEEDIVLEKVFIGQQAGA